MLQVARCPKHAKELVFFKDTATHSLFKCPVCDYVDYPGVVHPDLPEKFDQLQAKIKQLQAEIERLKKERRKWKCISCGETIYHSDYCDRCRRQS